MTKIMGCLLELEGIGKVDLIDLSSVKRFSCDSQAKAKEKAVQIFTFLDGNGDGKVDLKEFIFGCMKDNELVRILSCSGVKEKVEKEKQAEVRVIVVEEDGTTKDIIKPPFDQDDPGPETSDALDDTEKNIQERSIPSFSICSFYLHKLKDFGFGIKQDRVTLPNRVLRNRAAFPNCVLGIGQCFQIVIIGKHCPIPKYTI